jgi:hypothetical protein
MCVCTYMYVYIYWSCRQYKHVLGLYICSLSRSRPSQGVLETWVPRLSETWVPRLSATKRFLAMSHTLLLRASETSVVNYSWRELLLYVHISKYPWIHTHTCVRTYSMHTQSDGITRFFQDVDMCGMDDKELGVYMHKVRYNPLSPRVVSKVAQASWRTGSWSVTT